MLLLTHEDLAELTGYTRPSRQKAWLVARGWRFEIGGDQRPKVLRAYAERQLGLSDAAQPRRPQIHLPDGKTAQA